MSALSAIRRHHRERVIRNRMNFVRNVIGDASLWAPIGTLDKRKPLDCSCWACQGHAKFRWKRGKERHAIKARLRREFC